MKKMKKRLYRIIGVGVLFVAGLVMRNMLELPKLMDLGLFLVLYALIGFDVIVKSFRHIGNGNFLDENFLMVIATFGAFLVGDYPEGVAVMLFYQVGELFQDYAVDKSRKSITGLMELCPDIAHVIRDGAEVDVYPDEVEIGEILVVRPGERIPLDGEVVKGTSSLDTKALTGEALPEEVTVGSKVTSGCINLQGVLEVKVLVSFENSTVSKILELVENASSRKASAEKFITKFAKYYTPIVVGLAAVLAVVPSIVTGDWGTWVYRGLTFLVVSCPCALVISIPLGFFGGIGGASKHGILIKGGNYVEILAKVDTLVMDKTGTLTEGKFHVTHIFTKEGVERQEVLELAARAEEYSNHPIAISLKEAYADLQQNEELSAKQSEQVASGQENMEQVEELSGYGVRATLKGEEILVGNEKLMIEREIATESPTKAHRGTVVHVAKARQWLGTIYIEDTLKKDTKKALTNLQKLGVSKTVLLSGDRQETVDSVAAELGISKAIGQLLPDEKVDQFEKIYVEKNEKSEIAYVGDGMNDAPVLARADIGIAMGGLGSDAAIEAADVVLMADELSKIPIGIRIARKTMWIIRENIVFALGIKVAVLALTALGFAGMWAAIFADVGVAVLAILNAMRAMRVSEK